MRQVRLSPAWAAIALAATASPAIARALPLARPSLQLEELTDERRRGLSWSDGRPTIAAAAGATIADALDVSVTGIGLRGSGRHGAADLGIDLGAHYRHQAGPWRLSGGATGHAFAGRAALNYAELDASLAYLIGPASIGLAASYAPQRAAIGGDNLYLSANAAIAVIGTPWTGRLRAGRSSGDVDDPARAVRLRPGGAYWDYMLSLEHARGPVALGGRFTATSIDDDRAVATLDDRHAGKRLAFYVRLNL